MKFDPRVPNLPKFSAHSRICVNNEPRGGEELAQQDNIYRPPSSGCDRKDGYPSRGTSAFTELAQLGSRLGNRRSANPHFVFGYATRQFSQGPKMLSQPGTRERAPAAGAGRDEGRGTEPALGVRGKSEWSRGVSDTCPL